jgi:ATP-binding cassette subfamily C protein
VRESLALILSATQLLGGLKLAMSQNLQKSFTAEFERIITNLRRQQLSYQHQQANGQLAFATSARWGAASVFVGFGVMDNFGRMSAPATMILQGTQHFVDAVLPNPPPARVRIQDIDSWSRSSDMLARNR